MIKLTDELWDLICKINTDVNSNTSYMTDIENYQKSEFWQPSSENPNFNGDCEDYSLEKRKRLIETGEFGYEDLRLATCWCEGPDGKPGGGGYHAVLIVVTDSGDFCLDNRSIDPVLWNKFPYKWHRILVYDEKSKMSYWRTVK